MGLENVRRSLTVSEPAVVFHAGLLARQPPSALALEQVLSHYFAVPVQVDQFAGSWSPVRAGELTSLDDDAASPSNALGDGALVGDEVWDPQGGLRLRIGPLSREQFDAFLPGGSGHEPLRSLTRLATRGQFDVEAQLVLSREAVPALVLGGGDEEPGRLGWTTWLRSRPLELNPDDTTFCL